MSLKHLYGWPGVAAFLALSWLLSGTARAAATQRGGTFVLTNNAGAITFSAANGAILSVAQRGKSGTIWKSGERGLWQARFQDGSEINAAAFSTASPTNSFACRIAGSALRMTFRSDQIEVVLSVEGRADGADFVARVTPRAETLLDFSLPARLRFEAAQVERFIAPLDGNLGVGAAFKRAFFESQPLDKPSAWAPHAVGPQGYQTLYGGTLDQRPNQDPPATLQVTAEGREWLGAAVPRVDGARAVVNRAPARGQADLVLVDSPNGPYFSAKRLGNGAIWRVGGSVGDNEKPTAAAIVTATIDKLAAAHPPARTKLGLLSLTHGPASGGWAAVPVSDWLDRLKRIGAARRLQVVELANAAQISGALSSGDFLTILNPYGEQSPVIEGGMTATVAAIVSYIRGGGNWFESGGYPFYYELRPVRYFTGSNLYPAAFADFLHLDSHGGAASLYGVQPRNWAPWAGAKNAAAIFVPGRLGYGADEAGGYGERAFSPFVKAGQSWQAPRVRLSIGQAAGPSLVAYCQANAITRRLEDKMSPAVLQKLKNSVLVYYGGSAAEKIAHLAQLPAPTLIHFADYLKGGFDKEYPDHLPPHPNFGTSAELRALFDRSHALGHLVMPYTNPTWWPDHPRGPTFVRAGEAPLLKTLDGKLSYENYIGNDGYTVTHWHPAVRAANLQTLRQFSDEFPVDVLFQDQVGARSWRYDLNAASPSPHAYIEGLLSQGAEDSRTKPLSTEAGWDKVVNFESQLCGMSFQIVPTESAPEWRRLLKDQYPPATWEVFPLAQYIAHDKTMMLHHDLGQFVTNREVLSWTLGLGFSLSYRTGAAALEQDAPREWLRWLDRLQKSLVSRSIGAPVTFFQHNRGPRPTIEDDGVLRATYGQLQVTANVGPRSRVEGGHSLPPFGFRATAPGLVAGNLQKIGATEFGEEGLSFISQTGPGGTDVWVYAPEQQEVAVELPGVLRSGVPRSGAISLALDASKNSSSAQSTPAASAKTTINGQMQNGVLRFGLPGRGTQRALPPPALATKAPRDWPGQRPAIGILNFAGATQTWTRATPADWRDAFANSRLAKEMGAPLKFISTLDELTQALRGGAAAYHTIINPYGENLPIGAPDAWRPMLDLVRAYVENGGSWWETGGYTWHQAFTPGAPNTSIGPAGAAYLGLPIDSGEVEEAAQPLRVTPTGRRWLGEALSGRVEKLSSMVNRGLPRGGADPGHTALVAGDRQDFIGGYRLGGWGYLWRIGGFWPNAEAVLPVAVAATEYLYTHPPQPVEAGGIKYLWHVKVGDK